jgi:hypothetical protein
MTFSLVNTPSSVPRSAPMLTRVASAGCTDAECTDTESEHSVLVKLRPDTPPREAEPGL